MHKPCGQVHSITAKIIEGTGTVLVWVYQPIQELGPHTDFFRTLMAIAHDHFTKFAQFARFKLCLNFAIACIPGGFVVS